MPEQPESTWRGRIRGALFRRPSRPRRLRSHLLTLVAVALLPVLAISGFAIAEALASYRRAFNTGLANASHALAASVDRDIGTILASLDILATNPLLDLDEDGTFTGLAGFHERAVRAPGVTGAPVVLIDRDERIILHSSRPFGSTHPVLNTPDVARRVVATGRPVVGDLIFGAVVGTWIVPVVVPVKRDNRVVGALSSPMTPARLSHVLNGQGFTKHRFAAVVDGNGIIVARTGEANAIGRRANDLLLRARAESGAGIVEARSSISGAQVILAFRRIAAAPGWIAVVGEPSSSPAEEVWRPLLAFVGGGGAVLVLALLCAAWIGKHLLRDVEGLMRQADAVVAEGAGAKPVTSGPLPRSEAPAVAEFEELSKAIWQAHAALQAREERQMLLVREVDHRAKNALAVVQAIVQLTPTEDPKAFQQALKGRVNALARTHSTLAKQGWRATDLHALLKADLAPHLAALSLSGPPLSVAAIAAQPLSMVVHELATNAVKYGALSAPGGRISIVWWTGDGDLHLRWAEEGGPRVNGAPKRCGFGSRMIRANIERQLGGTVRTSWEPSLVCDIRVPLREMRLEGVA